MTPTETVALLRIVRAVCPAQKFDEFTSDAWAELLDDLRLDDCTLAVKHLGRRQPFIAPSDIRGEVKRIRKDRLDRVLFPVPPPELTPMETIAWQRDVTRQIADGTYIPPAAVEGTNPMPAIENTFRRVDE